MLIENWEKLYFLFCFEGKFLLGAFWILMFLLRETLFPLNSPCYFRIVSICLFWIWKFLLIRNLLYLVIGGNFFSGKVFVFELLRSLSSVRRLFVRQFVFISSWNVLLRITQLLLVWGGHWRKLLLHIGRSQNFSLRVAWVLQLN